MRRTTCLAAALLGATVNAYPRMPDSFYQNLAKRAAAPSIDSDSSVLAGLSKAEGNCGVHLCDTFNAKDQFVSTSGLNAYVKPGKGDIRGPCPGLNAAANHAYLPRTGVASITQTITGMYALYGMDPDLSGFLAAYAIVFDGDIITQTWSIGGPQPYTNVLGLLSPPQGISYSHNKYEGDSSIGRNDAYLNNGDAYSLNVTRFGYAYQTGALDGSDRYTLDKFRQDMGANAQRSVENNPYYFAAPFSTTLVVPAAYNFVINFMSNHSEKEPSGYLNGAMFKEFFAVTGDFDNSKEGSGFGFTWQPGTERIPKNWFKRPSSQLYNGVDVFIDDGIGYAAYPDTFRLGGNVNGVNSYEGVDLAKLTGGTYTNSNLSPKDLACLIYQSQQVVIPDFLKGFTNSNSLTASLNLVKKYSGFLADLGCPELAKYDTTAFEKYPGYSYSPKAPTS